MKKIISGFLAVCSLATCFSGMTAVKAAAGGQETAESEYTATAVFGKKTALTNIKSAIPSGQYELTYSNNKEVYKITNPNGIKPNLVAQTGKIYIDLDDEFFCGNTDGSEFLVTVDYVDTSPNCFTIKYDAISGTKEESIVYAEKTNLIKQHTFVLKDANFANNLDGKYDLSITFPSWHNNARGRSAMIAGVTIERIPGKYPVMTEINSEVAGHIFNYVDIPMFTNTFTNYTDEEKTVKVTYTAQNKLGNIEYQVTEEETFAPRETRAIENKLEIENYGLYYYTVSIDEFGYTNSTQFSYVNTARDGLFNDRFGYSSHMVIYDFDMQDQIDIVKKSNTRSIRDGSSWTWYGSDANADSTWTRLIQKANENGLDVLWVIQGHNASFGTTTFGWGDNDAQRQGFADFIFGFIENWGMKEDARIELWNEPNGGLATNSVEKTKSYAEWATDVAKRLHEKYPELRLGALSLCGITSPETTHFTETFTKSLIEAGGFEDIQAGTYHPYYANADPETGDKLAETLRLVDLVRDSGYENLEIWNTEIGWTKGISGTQRHFSATEQSAFHQRYFMLWDNIPTHLYYVYDFMKDGPLRDEREDLFGIIDNSLAPESGIPMLASEAYVTLTNMNNQVAGCNDYNEKVETNTENVYAYKYHNDARNYDLLTFWRRKETDKTPVRINLGTNSVTYIDSYGNETQLQSENGIYEMVPDFELGYLKGNFSNVSIEKADMEVSSLTINAIPNDMVSVKISGIKDGDRVEVRDKNFVKINGDATVKNGIANIDLLTPDLIEDNTSFELLIKNGDRTTSVMRIYLIKSELADANLSVSLESTDYTNWTATLNVKNNSEKNVIQGHVSLKEVGGENISSKKIYTGPIPAGKTASIKIPFPRIYERNIKEVDYELELSDGTVHSYTSTMNFAFAPYAKTPPTIDGKWDKGEWEENTSFEANLKSQVKQISDWAGPNDVSMLIYTAWDEDNFYVTAKIKDDIFYQEKQGSEIWMGDSIQFGLVYGEETSIVSGNFGKKYSEFGASKTPAGDQMYRWMSEDDSKAAGAVENYQLAVSRDNTEQTTIYEIALPWSEILPEKFSELDPNRTLGFSMLANDNDGKGRRGWIEYASGIGEGKDTSLFTFLNLVNVE